MRKIILLLIALLMASCTTNNNQQAAFEDTNTRLVKQYFAHFNDHEWRKIAEMYAETAAFKDPTLGAGIIKQTRPQIIKKYTQLHEAFPDVHDAIIQIYPAGKQHIVVEFISSGTFPGGSKFELPICTIFTIESNLITKDFSYFDNFEK